MTFEFTDTEELLGARAIHYQWASEAFRNASVALYEERDADADSVMNSYLAQYDDISDNPLEHMIRVGLLDLSMLWRAAAGDPNPGGPPTRVLAGSVVAVSKSTGEILDGVAIADFATEITMHVANWEFEEVENKMKTRTTSEYQSGNFQFLWEFMQMIMYFFIQMDGPALYGWAREN